MYNVCVKDLDEQMKKTVVKNKKKTKTIQMGTEN